MKLNDKQKQAVIEYMEQVNKLKGKPSRNKGLQNGRQQLVLVEKIITKSKAGNTMMKVRWVNKELGTSDYSYIMPNHKLFTKMRDIKVNDLCDSVVAGAGSFVKATPLRVLENDVELAFDDVMEVTNLITYDVEVFRFDWSVVFEDVLTGIQFKVENSLNKLHRFFQKHENNLFIGYNNKGYDQHILKGLVDGKNIYEISKQIIDGEDKTKVWKMYNGRVMSLAEVDLYQDNKGFGLKEHNAFNGLEIKETDIDFDIDRKLTEEEQEKNIYYNGKDVEGTTVRFINMIGALKTKAMLCELYDLDYTWLFKTNANIIAEILKAKFHEDRGDTFNKYEVPSWIRFDNPEIKRQVDEWILERDTIPTKYKTKKGEKILTTDLKYQLQMRDLVIELGSGGLHGAIKNFIRRNCNIKQADVGSLYPNTTVLHNYLSRNIPKEYAHLYSDILKDRMKFKKLGEKDKEQAMKLVLNTMYGVLRAGFNPLYDPRQAILINITGQLAMMDLAEKIEPYATISAMNTDSINYEAFDEECDKKIEEVKKEWCERSGYELDTDVIVDIAQANVNNYICRFDTGKVKTKGAVSMGGGVKWSKAVVFSAVKEYFMNDTPVEETIKNTTDMRDFQIISKTGWTYNKTILQTPVGEVDTQKVNRSFAVKEDSGHELVKIRKVKLGEIPENPNNGNDISETKEYKKQLKLYDEYVEFVKNRIDEFTIDSINELWCENNKSLVKGMPSEPEFYTIANESIEDCHVKLEELDFDYYIEEANHVIGIYNGTLEDDMEDDEEEEEEE